MILPDAPRSQPARPDLILEFEASLDLLSARERQVAGLAAGLTNPEIARALFISQNTVKTHLGRILHKLRLRRRIELASRRDLFPRALAG